MVLPVGRALTIGRAAGWWGGSQDPASLRSEDGTAFTPKPQPHPAWEQCLRCTQITQEKNSCLPASPTSGGKGISPRKDGSAQAGEWEAEQWLCFFIHVMKNTVHKRILAQREHREGEAYNTWIWWERLKTPAPQCKQSIAEPRSLERENKRSRRYPLWVKRGGDQANVIRGPVVAELGNRKAAENQGAFVWPVGDDRTQDFWQQLKKPEERAVSQQKQGNGTVRSPNCSAVHSHCAQKCHSKQCLVRSWAQSVVGIHRAWVNTSGLVSIPAAGRERASLLLCPRDSF